MFVAFGLLIVPFLVWLVVPSPPKITPPQLTAGSFEVSPPPLPKPANTQRPSPRPTPPPAEPSASSEEGGAPLKGRVLGPDGAPVAAAFVECEGQPQRSSITGPDGEFELPKVALGCSVVARRPGFGASAPVILKAGDARQNTLELKGGGKIEGVVVDEKGAPIKKFMLAVEKFIGEEGDDEGSNGRARTVENEAGKFVMENATPGKYVLSVSAEGRPPSRSDAISVEAGRSASGIRIVLSAGATLSGTIVDVATRKPIEGARIALDSVTSTGVSSAASVKSDAAGAYLMVGVPANGPFSIRVEKDGYRSRVVSGLSVRNSSALTADVQLTARGEGEGDDSELGGIGAVLAPHPNALGAVVVSVTPNGPAARAGLARQDWIVRIDGASTETLTMVDCIQRLRGPAGSRVSLTVNRNGKEVGFDLTRENIVVQRPGRN